MRSGKGDISPLAAIEEPEDEAVRRLIQESLQASEDEDEVSNHLYSQWQASPQQQQQQGEPPLSARNAEGGSQTTCISIAHLTVHANARFW